MEDIRKYMTASDTFALCIHSPQGAPVPARSLEEVITDRSTKETPATNRPLLKCRVPDNINFNTKKSVVIIVKTREDKQNLTSFYLGDQVLKVVNKIKYLGQIIRDYLNDDDDMQRQCCKLYGHANMLARKILHVY